MVLSAGLFSAMASNPLRAAVVEDMDLAELVQVRLSPFDVSSHLDRGYRVANSVSASRIDAPIRELPFAVQAFPSAFIDDQNPIVLHDVARYSPGVTYRSNDFNEGHANLAIRGFAVSSVPGAVQVLRDGFHGPSILDMTNVERVEVVKGPSSLLYGQVAPGGIVNVVTKSPLSSHSASAELGVGSYGRYRAEADLGGPVAPGLFYRLSASHDQDIDYWRPYDGRWRNIAPSLRWQPNERLSLTLKAEDFRKIETPQLMQKPGYGRQSGVVPTPADPNLQGVEVPGLPDDWNTVSNVDYRRSRARGLSLWADLRLDERWNLRLGASRQLYSVDALFSGNLGMANNTTFLQGRRVRRQTYDNQGTTLSADAVGHYRFEAASLRVLTGAQVSWRRFGERAGQLPNDPALGTDPIGSPFPLWDLRDPGTWNRDYDLSNLEFSVAQARRTSRYLDRALMGAGTLGLMDDRLLLLAGWRLTTTESVVEDQLASTSTQIDGRRVTPQYGLLYKLTPSLSAFASYAESFVPGQRILNRLDGSSGPAAPSIGRGWDLGLKFDSPDDRVSATLTVYGLRNSDIVNDIARTDASGAVVISSLQSGEQRSRGVEIDATLEPSIGWQVYMSYSYMDARIVEVTGNDAAILAQDPATLDAAGQLNYKNVALLHGARLQMSAPHLANLWTRYDLPSGPWSGRAYIGGGFNLVRDQTILPDGPASSRQSYTLVNALVGWSWMSAGRRHSLELAGRNLSDAKYRPSQSTRARPRELLLTFKAQM